MERTEADRLYESQVRDHLPALPGWEYNGKEVRIERTYTRKNFLDGVAFIEKIAEVAEKQDHHPDILLFGYKYVRVMLSTHSAKGITQNDFDLAGAIDKL